LKLEVRVTLALGYCEDKRVQQSMVASWTQLLKEPPRRGQFSYLQIVALRRT